MKSFFYALTAVAGLATAGQANAATFVRDMVFDLSAYAPGSTAESISSPNLFLTPISTISAGDTITGTVSFDGGRSISILDQGSTEFVQMLLWSDGNSSYQSSSTIQFLGLVGAVNPGPYPFFTSGGAVGAGAFQDLTPGVFRFTGFTYTITVTSITTLGAPTTGSNLGVYASFRSTRGIVNAVAGVPEPETWAMLVLGFGAVGFAMRRRTNTDVRVRYA